ncbi:MAG: glycine zipper 2TM domain-containing protein [Novosphingobium sp.]|nr:glycine zipper 2TM domain-containing protein [Novosphingobium sp.]
MHVRKHSLRLGAGALLLASTAAGASVSAQDVGDAATDAVETAATAVPTVAAPVYPAPTYAAPVYPSGAPPVPVYPGAYPGAYPAAPMHYATPYNAGAPMLAPADITARQAEYDRARADWISECASRYRRDHRGGNGGLIGGLVGALIGGFAGNRIDDDGDRLAGTLIGAGVGGVAGAAMGALASAGSRKKSDTKAVAWCEDYLASHTQMAPAYGYYGGHGYNQAMMMVPVMVPKKKNCQCREVIEEVVDEPRPIRRSIPKPRPDKRIKLAPDKRIPL